MPASPQTWHHGLVAEWWAEFNQGGPEIAYFRRAIERGGEPALDVACGTGRLLIPYLQAGLDVDGWDVSADMVALCREQAARAGLSPTLLVQPMHELQPPRRYRTIVVCGAFGLGSTRVRDQEALARFHVHLEAGGTLVLDNEVPYANARQWHLWLAEERRALPDPFERPPPEWRRPTSDGAELALRARTLDLDPLAQRVTLEMHAERWRDGALEAEEKHALTSTLYFSHELLLMLERAGFTDVVVHGGHTERQATADDEFVVFVAKKPGA
jgi:SAM-dependent methyltransferase